MCARKTRSRADWQNSSVRPSDSQNSRTRRSAVAPSGHFFTSKENSSNLMPRQDFTPATSLGQVAERRVDPRARAPVEGRETREEEAPRRRTSARAGAAVGDGDAREDVDEAELIRLAASAACATTRDAHASMLSLADLGSDARGSSEATERGIDHSSHQRD